MEKTFSIIIPTLNEETTLEFTLNSIPTSSRLEIIVVDGNSQDRTREIAYTRTSQVYISPPGRARQMNLGAQKAQGKILLFLHADSMIPAGGLEAISKALEDPQVIGGAFRLRINATGWGYRLIAWGANLRTRLLGLPYGDQGIFIRRKIFQKMGGFQEIPLMEDIDLVRRMKKIGSLRILPQPLLTSARRWEKEGLLYTTLRNWSLASLYLLGVSPHRLYHWYRPVR
ncbi:MAG TPA: TIGR04283 family arsenosugar biosynthesis glycosyltransferase [Candidatus Limnocylindrales bacterium]|nr:TIGR04283 family arsenosugar biosynthesis glycosyltransferase [Candidatus Limnocylindrales bacterium]